MKSRDFCYWLQGFFELTPPNRDGSTSLTDGQVQLIKNHLNMVFKHEIDPSNGTPEHNAELSKLHTGSAGIPGPGLMGMGSIETKYNC